MKRIVIILLIICPAFSSESSDFFTSALSRAFRHLLEPFCKQKSKDATNRLIIAHRGASGYLPEHTAESKVLAHQMGADYIEQDLVLSKDNRLIVLHDLYLERVSNVADIFPERRRENGHFYVIDFTVAEMKTLTVTETFNIDQNGKREAVFPNRFPLWKSNFSISTFEEEIELIQGLNKVLGKNVGIYPEIKRPWFHYQANKDITLMVLKTLKNYGYTSQESKVYLQCFDPNELKRIREQLLPQLGMDVKLVQLMAETSWETTYEEKNGLWVPYNNDWMFEEGAMEIIAKYAQGVGPWFPMIIEEKSTRGNIKMTNLVDQAHRNRLQVHAYTFRAEEHKIPSYATDFENMLEIFFKKAHIDGVFTDFPDRAVIWNNVN